MKNPNNRRLWNRQRKVNQRQEKLLSEFIALCRGNYNYSSTIHNKVIFLYTKRFVIPSRGQEESARIATLFANVDDEDLMQEFYLCLTELSSKYRKEKSSLSIGGYMSYMLPYYIKRLIDRYAKQLDLFVPSYLSGTEDDPTADISSLTSSMKYMRDFLGLSSSELAKRYLVNPVSIRRRCSK